MGPIQRITWLENVAAKHTNSAGTISVAISLAKHANNETGLAWPSLATLSKRTGLERSTVRRALTRLLKAGFLSKLEKGKPDGTSTTYRLIHIGAQEPLGVGAQLPQGRGSAASKVGAPEPPKPNRNLKRTNARARAREEDQAAAPQGGSPGQLKEPRWRHIAQRHWPWYARQLGKDGTLRYLDSFKGKAEAMDRLSAAWRTATEEQRLRVRLEADKDEGVAA